MITLLGLASACMFWLPYTVASVNIDAAPTYTLQSGPYQLYVESSNKDLNGRYLRTRHAGAALQELVLGERELEPDNNLFCFNFNYTDLNPALSSTEIGQVVWTLYGHDFTFSCGMTFDYNRLDNAIVIQFIPGPGHIFSFRDDKLYAVFYTHDAEVPVQFLNQFYACGPAKRDGTGILWTTVFFGVGAQKEKHPDCQQVSIKRTPIQKS